jgi:signal transduction histidine kinase
VGAPGSDIGAVLDILSRADDADLADVVELVAKLCDAQAAGITILMDGDYHVPVTYGIAPFVCPSSDTFCQHAMGTTGVFTVEDARNDPRFDSIGWVDGTIASARFYASAPINAPDGTMVGRLCVIDPKVRALTPLQRSGLETLAASLTQLIELRLLRDTRRDPASPDSSQAAATVVSQLAAELSHDLKVPLSSISASAELLTEELADHDSPVVEALLTRVTRAAHRMQRMLDQSLDYGVAGGSHELELAVVDLGQVAEQLVAASTEMLDATGAVVETADLPVVRADPDDMYSVLQNLLSNSVKFARPGIPPRVHISGRRTGDGWRISVRDNGIGIPADRQVDVFSLFSRVESDVEGHGIGLATVARILAAHDGRAGASSAPGGGAEIWFELPDADEDDRSGSSVGGPG